MYYFSFQAEFEDQLYLLQPSLFFNDVVTLKDRVVMILEDHHTHALLHKKGAILDVGSLLC